MIGRIRFYIWRLFHPREAAAHDALLAAMIEQNWWRGKLAETEDMLFVKGWAVDLTDDGRTQN